MVDPNKIINIINIAFIVIAIVFTLVSILLNINVGSKLDFLSKYGSREKLECGNEYMEIDTPNYQIYNQLSTDNKSLASVMLNGFILLQVSWMVIILGLTISICYDYFNIWKKNRDNNQLNPNPNKFYKRLSMMMMVLTGISWALYFSLYIALGIQPILANIKAADISTDRKGNIKKLLKLYLPTLSILIPIIGLLFINKEETNTIYMLYAVLYIIVIVLAIKFNSKSLDLITNFDSSYKPIVDDIQSKITTLIGTTNPTAMPQMPPTTVSDKLKYILIHNIKSVEKIDGDNFILNDYKDQYWKYLIHQNGNELSEIYNDANTTEKATIDTIRTQMRELRKNTNLTDLVDEYTSTTLYFSLVMILIIAFGLFHLVFKHLNKPITATLGIGVITVLLLISGPIYGWIMRVKTKTN